LNPHIPPRIFGFKDRCVYHSAIRAQSLDSACYRFCKQKDQSVNAKGNEQLARFKQAARELECDEDGGRWDDRLRKVAGTKPAPDLKAK
jgi:hypothetical protein